jgi:hypothetical protein
MYNITKFKIKFRLFVTNVNWKALHNSRQSSTVLERAASTLHQVGLNLGGLQRKYRASKLGHRVESLPTSGPG